MGGMNYHIEVQFEDGVSWLARIRRFNATSPPAGLRNYIMRSEVATLQFLSRTNVPSPKVFDFDLDESNPIGVSYILMEKMSGRTVGTSLSKASRAEQRMKVLDQLADIYIDLSAYPFDVMGSLDQTGTTHVGAFAHESLTDFRDSQMKPTGPCSSIQEYCTESIHLILDLIMRQEIYTSRPVDAFLIHLFLLDVVPKVFSSTDLDDGRFYMRHADDKGDHILIDDDYNITAIIDWEWAYTAPKPVAFNSPIGLLPVNDFYNGDNDIGKDEVAFAQLLEEKGRSDLGKIVRNGRLIHRFNFYCAYDLGDWDGFLGLFFGLLKGLGYEGDLDWETWKGEALKRYREDDRLQQLIGVTRSD